MYNNLPIKGITILFEEGSQSQQVQQPMVSYGGGLQPVGPFFPTQYQHSYQPPIYGGQFPLNLVIPNNDIPTRDLTKEKETKEEIKQQNRNIAGKIFNNQQAFPGYKPVEDDEEIILSGSSFIGDDDKDMGTMTLGYHHHKSRPLNEPILMKKDDEIMGIYIPLPSSQYHLTKISNIINELNNIIDEEQFNV